MTVEELIELLKKLPQKYVVILPPDYCEIESVFANHKVKEVVIK